MQALSTKRSSLSETAVAFVLPGVAVGLLGLVLAYWTWVWLAPRPEPRAQAPADGGGRAEAAYGLFGSGQRDRSSAAPTGIAIKLLGVVAASGGRRGYAVVEFEPRQIIAVRGGDDIVPGIRLAEVHPDHVVLERNGARETLAWPEKKTSAESSAHK
jgi:general secretion pathway protein C